MTTVAIAGGFDPFHDGHLDHLLKASKLADQVLIFVSNDADMIRKKGKYCLPLKLRLEILKTVIKYFKVNAKIYPTLDLDGTQVRTLEHFKPDIFAKGAEYNEENIPESELELCRRLGIKVVFGIGKRLNSSTQIMTRKEG